MIISMDYDEKLFLFEECRYILVKWKQKESMNVFISRMVSMDDIFFISHYMMDIETKNSSQIDLMMIMSGSNSQLFMEIVVRDVASKTSLGKNIKYLLEKVNLPLCFEQNEALCYRMFDKLSGLPELTLEDQTFLFKTFRESMREVSSRKMRRTSRSHVYSRSDWKDWFEICQTADDIVQSALNGVIDSMFSVIILLVHVARLNVSSIDARTFVSVLVDHAGSKYFKKVSYEFVDLVLALLRKSERPEKITLIETLQLVRDRSELSSQFGNVTLNQDLPFTVKLTNVQFNSNYFFEFRHPGLSITKQDCDRPSKCGFIIQGTGFGNAHEMVLCKSDGDYIGTNIHYHDLLAAEDMFYYKVWSGKLSDGSVVMMPFRWRWASGLNGSIWSWLFPSITDFGMKKLCVAINVQNYLVWKGH
jgi:hypothetical protein